jgi:hypothetical protein
LAARPLFSPETALYINKGNMRNGFWKNKITKTSTTKVFCKS